MDRMFLNTCNGCIQVPTPVYYWNPYFIQAYGKKPSTFQISDILQSAQNSTVKSNNGSSKQSNDDLRKYSDVFDLRVAAANRKFLYDATESERSRRQDADSNGGALNYSTKNVSSGGGSKCSVPSALEPLQALCTAGPRGYRTDTCSPCSRSSSRCNNESPSPRELKFGINKILSEEFGKEKQIKENKSHRPAKFGSRSSGTCECTYDGCHGYSFAHARYPSHALSAVHALQPPKYPTSPSGTDILPGPYSVLSTEVSAGNQSKRKRSWSRAVFSNLQRKGLEKRFEVQKYVTKPDRRQLAAMLGLTDAQVKVWFQNRRMKWRHAQQQQTLESDNSAENADDKITSTENCRTSPETPESDTEYVNKDALMDTDGDSSDDEDISVIDIGDNHEIVSTSVTMDETE